MRSISASVGQGGKNLKPDVVTVQELLNKVPFNEGGPQMSRPDRMISTSEIHRVINSGELVEDYPEDARLIAGVILKALQK